MSEEATHSTFDEAALEEAYARALRHEKAGRSDDAAKAYRQCIEIDPEDHAGARLRLAALGHEETPPSAGDAYVATLFDQTADSFEDILVGQLGYGVPGLIAERIADVAPGPYTRMLDLGCGTGLAGRALRPRVDTIIGIDLSEGMVETCFDTGLYDHLYIGEAVGFLEDFEEDELFDLIVAADMLPYLGDLDPLLAGIARRSAPGGTLALSTETLPDPDFGTRDIVVGRDHRFHHREGYLRDRLDASGFEVLDLRDITVRQENGRPAPGHLVIARKR
ncbi:methyltransferase domain-containing protein [Aurantimonas sp. VKM B-3413]|uniref:methyltransferase domain-containing protein n=1 Tax=Aurantimonas sp. VKM B-3413 TaxID=2779401 RepID=UPI001E605D8E|nr:methyltransferase domain-containing protein [Aurantimonas sp. VKM B-3413]MCB8836923.1 methyltransferase domain-containing protein [Aurantimonas sp. VKM B-3413]